MELHLFDLGRVDIALFDLGPMDEPPPPGMHAYVGTYNNWFQIERYVAQKIKDEGGRQNSVTVQVAIFDGKKLTVAAEHKQGKWEIILPGRLGLPSYHLFTAWAPEGGLDDYVGSYPNMWQVEEKVKEEKTDWAEVAVQDGDGDLVLVATFLDGKWDTTQLDIYLELLEGTEGAT